MWNDPQDPNKGVKPIEGGPATQIPAEMAARLGMADSFLGQLPEIKQSVEKGDATGPIDYAQGLLGWGEAGSTRRKIDSGVGALLRMLTGAGMPQAEAEQYVTRYKPTMFDDANILADKMNQLERELITIREKAMKGRGGAQLPADSVAPQTTAPATDNPVIIDGYKIRKVP